jgi:hypothetical protein
MTLNEQLRPMRVCWNRRISQRETGGQFGEPRLSARRVSCPPFRQVMNKWEIGAGTGTGD